MKNPKRKAPFIGAGTALATPFSENGIDFPALGAMIDYQIGAGIDALVLCGTTGESVTLTEKEYDAVTAFAAEKIHGRVPYLVGCGSADTAKAFGIDPRVAMITYSTGKSGKGPDVDLMTEATKIAQELRPDLTIDGPLQYDAAVMPDVAAQKAPGSKVAGKATVFIFPSLSTGNTVYKAVQRSANVVAIGPMLQGLNKPVNDLSRGALVDDIVYTIAITAIQAGQKDQK